MSAIRLSNLQSSFLQKALDEGGITLEEMLNTKQTTAGSAIKQGWLRWHRESERFVPTDLGLEVCDSFRGSDVSRKTSYRPLSGYITNREILALSAKIRETLKEEARTKELRDRMKQDRSSRIIEMKNRTDQQRKKDKAKGAAA